MYIPGVSKVFLYGLYTDQFVSGHWAETPPLQPKGHPRRNSRLTARDPAARRR